MTWRHYSTVQQLMKGSLGTRMVSNCTSHRGKSKVEYTELMLTELGLELCSIAPARIVSNSLTDLHYNTPLKCLSAEANHLSLSFTFLQPHGYGTWLWTGYVEHFTELPRMATSLHATWPPQSYPTAEAFSIVWAICSGLLWIPSEGLNFTKFYVALLLLSEPRPSYTDLFPFILC